VAVAAHGAVAGAGTAQAVLARRAGGVAGGWAGTARRADAGSIGGLTAQF